MPGVDCWRHGRDFKVVHYEGSRALLFLAGNHRLFEITPDLARRMERDGPQGLTASEAEEWAALARAGVLAAVNPGKLAGSRYADGANLALNINLTAVCNLSCTYCFADGGDYGRITGRMRSSMVEKIFAFVKEHVTPSRVARFEFFGGEPLLNYAIIEELCRRGEDFSEETGVRFLHRISTNLTVLPGGAPELFRRKRFVVSVSIDGGPATHDKNRPTKSGQGSFAQILANCQRVREVGGDDVILVARMTVVSDTPSLVENVAFLRDYNLFDYFQIYPSVTSASRGCGSAEPSALVQIGGVNRPKPTTMSPTFLRQLDELLTLYPAYFTADNRFRGVLEYERLAQMVLEGKMALGFCGAGETYFTFSPDESIMPCHRLVGDRTMQVGTADEGLTGDTSTWTLPVDRHPVCSGCWARYACGGNCRQENYLATGDLRVLNEETCGYQLSLLEGVLRLLGRTGGRHHPGDRDRLDNLFVSCGRPVVPNGRDSAEPPAPWPYRHFVPVS